MRGLLSKFLHKIKTYKKQIEIHFLEEIDESKIEELLLLAASNIRLIERKNKDYYVFYPSELSKCVKQSYERYKDPKLTPTTRRTALGNIYHFGIEKALKELQKKLRKRFFISNFPVKFSIKHKDKLIIISGSIDLVSKNAVIEIKSKEKVYDTPDFQSIIQTGFYAMYMRKKFNRHFDAYIVQISRKVLDIRIHKLDESDIKLGYTKIIERALELYEALEGNIEPVATPGFYCIFCPVLNKCKEGREFLSKQGVDEKMIIENNGEFYNKIVSIAEKYLKNR